MLNVKSSVSGNKLTLEIALDALVGETEKSLKIADSKGFNGEGLPDGIKFSLNVIKSKKK